MKGRVSFVTIGCKVNLCESGSLAELFKKNGWEVVAGEDADVYVLNTCTVTAQAERKCRQEIRKLARKHPKAQIVVMGCYAQVAPEELKLPGVKVVVGTQNRAKILELVESQTPGKLVGPLEPGLAFEDLGVGTYERTRATLKIQDGCHQHCTYCRVRLARGPIRSLPEARVLELARELVAQGMREIVLSGVNLGAWGLDQPERPQLWQLLDKLAQIPDLARIRLGSIEPGDVTDELLEVMAARESLCHHLHLPLQSGSGKILRLMGRGYTPDDFARTVERIRGALPSLGLTADVMVAFPGEGEVEFEESYQFIKKLGFSRLHVFSYSKRPGTPALKLGGHLSKKEAHARSQALLALGGELAENYHRRFLEKKVEIILEEETEGVWEGLTEQYVRVWARGEGQAGQLRWVQVQTAHAEGLEGILD